MSYQAEKLMKDNPDKLDDKLKDDLLKAIENARDVVKNKGDDAKAVDDAKEQLEKPLHELAQKIYAQGGPAGAGGPGAPGGPGGPGPGGMGGNMEDVIRRAQQAANMGGQGAPGGQPSGEGASGQGPSDKKKKVVDVEWEDEE